MNLIIGLIGNVDQGKTHFMDWVFNTRIINSEPGQITQSLRIRYLGQNNLKSLFTNFKKVPLKKGIYLIDTPGHGYFKTIQTLIYSLTDVIMVFQNITQKINPKTINLIKELQSKNHNFVIVLTKLDLISNWNIKSKKFLRNLELQDKLVKDQFDRFINSIILDLNKYQIYSDIFNLAKSGIPLFPISNITGQGIPELLLYCNLKFKLILDNRNNVLLDKLDNNHLFLTFEHIPINSQLFLGSDKVTIKKILDINKKSATSTTPRNCYYITFKQDLTALIGSILSKEIRIVSKESTPKGFILKSDSLGKLLGLESLMQKLQLDILESSLLPIRTRDIMLSMTNLKQIYKNIICLADTNPKTNAKILYSNVIYILEEKITELISELQVKRKKEILKDCILPCRLRILSDCIFKKSNPYVIGCYIEFGTIFKNTKISNNRKDCIGEIINIQINHKKKSSLDSGIQAAFEINSNLELEELVRYNYFQTYIKDCIPKLNQVTSYLTNQQIENVREWSEVNTSSS
jgi:translation initiation factor IF-2